MKAVVLIDGAAYGQVALKVMTQAFDAAWSEIAPRFKGDRLHMQSARLELADAILSVAKKSGRDVEELKVAALEIMARSYRQH